MPRSFRLDQEIRSFRKRVFNPNALSSVALLVALLASPAVDAAPIGIASAEFESVFDAGFGDPEVGAGAIPVVPPPPSGPVPLEPLRVVNDPLGSSVARGQALGGAYAGGAKVGGFVYQDIASITALPAQYQIDGSVLYELDAEPFGPPIPFGVGARFAGRIARYGFVNADLSATFTGLDADGAILFEVSRSISFTESAPGPFLSPVLSDLRPETLSIVAPDRIRMDYVLSLLALDADLAIGGGGSAQSSPHTVNLFTVIEVVNGQVGVPPSFDVPLPLPAGLLLAGLACLGIGRSRVRTRTVRGEPRAL